MPELENDKHERFCQEFIRDLNGTRAYRDTYTESGYNTCRTNASRLLADANIQARIAELKEERAKSLNLDAQSVLHDLKTYLESDVTDFIDLTPEQVKGLPIELRRMVTGFKLNEETTTTPEGIQMVKKRFELTFFDKKAAYEMVNRHIGFYEVDNKQRSDIKVIVQSQEEADKLDKI